MKEFYKADPYGHLVGGTETLISNTLGQGDVLNVNNKPVDNSKRDISEALDKLREDPE